MRINYSTTLVMLLFLILSILTVVNAHWAEWLALILIILAGIPHGSFDLRVAREKWHSHALSLRSISLVYLTCVFSMTALCVFAPPVGLSIFLVLSVLHFAEGEGFLAKQVRSWIGLWIGSAAILLPIGLHADQSKRYIEFFISPAIFEQISAPLTIVSSVVFVALSILLIVETLRNTRGSRITTFERALCLVGWAILPPLSGFAVWFIGRHSRIHLEHCMKHCEKPGALPIDFVIISAIAIVGLLPFTLLFNLAEINDLFAASICLIAGLTLPHMIVSHGMYRKSAASQ